MPIESFPQNQDENDLDFTKPETKDPETGNEEVKPPRDWDKDIADPSDLTTRRFDAKEN